MRRRDRDEGRTSVVNQKASIEVDVTEHEGMLLSVALRQQPVTAYQLVKAFELSPVTSINASKGQVYPAVRRLKAKGFLRARKLKGDGRNSEELEVTAAGRAAVRAWVLKLEDSLIVVDDPLRTRMLALELLTDAERLKWTIKAKSLVKRRREVLDDYNQSVNVPYQSIAYRSVVESLRVKMDWLDELLYAVTNEK